ncbi:MAG TPA: ATP-dependent helicase, partial [Ktedonobacterales bacterium]|nr:ATP-dependent helicase [Ktedonobacterales bacterium]
FFHNELLLDAKLAARYQEFFLAYEAAKKQSKSYDLADLIYIPLRLLESSPTYRKRWQGMYQYLQVDETQDTSPSQYRLIQHLAAGHRNVVIVGDPDQAIYNFRGASPEASILSFKRMYPGGTIYRIEHNYRSTPQILDAANHLISNNESMAGFEKVLRPTLPDGAPVVVTAYEDQESESRGIAARIEQLVASATGQPDAFSYRDIFVLSRTNHHLASLEMALAHKRIPYRTLGGSSFFKRKTTRDMLAYLALVDGARVHQEYLAACQASLPPKWDDVFTPVFCGEQNAAFRTVAHIPSRDYLANTGKTSHRFTPTLYAMLTAKAAGRPLLQFCEEQSYAVDTQYQPGMKDFVALVHRIWQSSKNHPVAAIRAIRELAYDAHLRHRDANHTEDQEEDSEAPRHEEDTRLESRYEELEELTNIAQRHQSIRQFLQAMVQLKEQSEDTSKNKRDCVSLLTVHKSKGLEQRVVFVIGLVEGIFPHQRSFSLSADDTPVVQSGIAEERRLAYVAFTRAQQRLFLSSLVRYRGGDATPSRFIHEAGLTPTDETGILNPYRIKRDGSVRKPEPAVTAPTLFDSL